MSLHHYMAESPTADVPPGLLAAGDALAECLDTFEWPQHEMAGEAFTISETPRGGLDLEMQIWVRNNEDPDDEDLHPLRVSQPISEGQDPQDAILQIIVDFLRHETREQLMFDGVAALYPHDEHGPS